MLVLFKLVRKKVVSLDTFRNIGGYLVSLWGWGRRRINARRPCLRNLSMANKGHFQLITRKYKPWGLLLGRLSPTLNSKSLDREKYQTNGKEI